MDHHPRFITREHAKLRPPTRAPAAAHGSPGIIFHCTAGRRPADDDDALAAWRAAQVTHQQGNGWSDIGYHFGIAPSGAILEGRGWDTLGAHAKDHNRCIGVVVQGKGVDLTEYERATIDWIIAEHDRRHGRGFVVGHRFFSPRKSCPGPAVLAYLAERYRDRTTPAASPPWVSAHS